jgi:LCP family protein required for cell wall assembly
MILLLALFTLVMAVAPAAAQDEEAAPAWDGTSRFTLLIMGMDRRPGDGDTLVTRTDANMLVSYDPATNSLGILHIPRDLHFAPPGTERLVRVNTLLQEGELIQEGYGPYYVMDTLQYNLGIYIDRFVMFDFEAFITVVDAIGGIEVTITYTIDDPQYPNMSGGFDPFFLPPGTHRLDGYDALRFARTRHGDNDFVRGIRQMQVIEAIYTRLAEDGIMARLMPQADVLMDSLRENVYTDLALEDMLMLGLALADVPSENIATGGINSDSIVTYAQPSGRSIYVPDRTRLADLMIEVFGDNYSG